MFTFCQREVEYFFLLQEDHERVDELNLTERSSIQLVLRKEYNEAIELTNSKIKDDHKCKLLFFSRPLRLFYSGR